MMVVRFAFKVGFAILFTHHVCVCVLCVSYFNEIKISLNRFSSNNGAMMMMVAVMSLFQSIACGMKNEHSANLITEIKFMPLENWMNK